MISAKFSADFASFNTSVQEATAQLRTFETGASQVGSSLTRMGNSFSGRAIITDATLMAKAIQDAGGASTLTEKELARVSATIGEATAKMKALGMEAPASIAKLSDELARTSSTTQQAGGFFNDLKGHILATAAGFVTAEAAIGLVKTGFQAVLGFLTSSVDAWAKQEQAVSRLTAALRAHGTATPEIKAQYLALSQAIEQHTIFTDEDIVATEALLVQVGNIMPSQMGAALKAVTNLSAGLGIDLHAATMLVAKAASGHTETLGRYGITVSDAALQTKGFTAVLETIESHFGGQAAAQIDTYSGHVTQLANAWDNFKENIGRVLVQDPLVIAALEAATQHADTLKTSTDKSSDSWVLWAASIGRVSPALRAYVIEAEAAAEVSNSLRAAIRAIPAPPNLSPEPASVPNWKAVVTEVDKAKMAMSDMKVKTEALSGAQRDAAKAGFQQGLSVDDVVKALQQYWPGIDKSKIALDALKKSTDASAAAHTKAGADAKKASDEMIRAAEDAAAAEVAAFQLVLGSIDKSRLATENAQLIFKGLILTWEESLNIAKGFTSNGLIPMVAGLDDATRAATAQKTAADALNKTHQNFAAAINTISTLPNVFPQMTKEITAATTATDKATTGMQDLSSALGSLAGDFAQMAQIGGDSFGQIARDIGLSIKAAEALSTALALSGIGGGGLAAPKAGDKAAASRSGVGGAAVGLGVAGAAAAGTTAAATASVASIASIAGAWIAVGIAVYSVIASISKAAEEAAHAAQKMDRMVGLAKQFAASSMFSGSLGDAVEATNTRLDEMATTTFTLTGVFKGFTDYFGRLHDLSASINLPEVIKELGGVSMLTGEQIQLMGHHFENLFGLIEVGGPLAVDATKAMDDGLVAFGKSAIDAGGFVNQVFLDTIENAQAAGIELAGVGEFLKGQFSSAATGLTALFGGMEASATAAYIETAVKAGASIEEATKAAEEAGSHWVLASKDQAAGLGATVAATFSGMLANGATLREALGSIQEPLATLQDAFNKAAVGGGQAFDFLSAMADIAGNAITGPLVDSIDGARSALLGLGNTGHLNQEMFLALGGTATDAYNKIIAQGKSADAAMAIMQPTLQTLWEGQQRFGFETGAATQLLIDQGVESGTVGEQFVGAQDKMALAMERTNMLLETLVVTLGGTLPAAIATLGDKTTTTTKQQEADFKRVANAAYGITGAVNTVGGQLDASIGDFDYWSAHAVAAANEVYDAVNAVSFGQSPGGIKEIPIQLRLAERAMEDFADVAVSESRRVERAQDSMQRSIEDVTESLEEWARAEIRAGAIRPPAWDTGPQTEALRRAFDATEKQTGAMHRLSDATREVIDFSDRVVSSQDSVRDAILGTSDAIRTATSDMGEQSLALQAWAQAAIAAGAAMPRADDFGPQSNALRSAFGARGFSEGGRVLPFPGASTVGDSVPAMLTPGERVLTVSQNKDYEAGGNNVVDFAAYAERLEAKMEAMQRRQEYLLKKYLPKAMADAAKVTVLNMRQSR